MRTFRAWMMRFSGLFRKQHSEREMQDEIESHLAMHVADNVRAGMSEEEARRDAVLKLGGVESLIEAYRERSTAPFLEHLALDIRFAFRQLRKNRGFAATAVMVLALAMCASLAIFTFVDAALIRPLPYPKPARLAAVTERYSHAALLGLATLAASFVPARRATRVSPMEALRAE